jgi:hypothetical protein
MSVLASRAFQLTELLFYSKLCKCVLPIGKHTHINMKRRDDFEDTDVDWRIILKMY